MRIVQKRYRSGVDRGVGGFGYYVHVHCSGTECTEAGSKCSHLAHAVSLKAQREPTDPSADGFIIGGSENAGVAGAVGETNRDTH